MRTFFYFSQAWNLVKNNKLVWLFSAVYTLATLCLSLLTRLLTAETAAIGLLWNTLSMIVNVSFQAGMIYTAFRIYSGEAVALKDIWHGVETYWFRIFVWGFVYVLISIGLLLPLGILFFWGGLSQSDLLCILVPYVAVIMVIVDGLAFFGWHGIVIKNLKIVQCIKPSFRLLWQKLFPFLGFSFLSLLISMTIYLLGVFVVAPLAGAAYASGENFLAYWGTLSTVIPYQIFSYLVLFLTAPFWGAANTAAYMDFANIRAKGK
jgi:hypothetical protein